MDGMDHGSGDKGSGSGLDAKAISHLLANEAAVIWAGASDGLTQVGSHIKSELQQAQNAVVENPGRAIGAYASNHAGELAAGFLLSKFCGNSSSANLLMAGCSFAGVAEAVGTTALRAAAPDANLNFLSRGLSRAVNQAGCRFVDTLPMYALGSKLASRGRFSAELPAPAGITGEALAKETFFVAEKAGEEMPAEELVPGLRRQEYDGNEAFLRAWQSPMQENPALEDYKQAMLGIKHALGADKASQFFSAEWEALKKLTDFRQKYGYAVVDQNALSVIASEAGNKPIVEIGAGNGYLSHLLRRMDLQVTAYDLHPVDGGKNNFFSTSKVWTEVLPGDESAILNHPDCVLFMSWPPHGASMANRTLKNFTGDKFIYIGESSGGCCASDAFYDRLEKHWRLEKEVDIPRWPGAHDTLKVYARRNNRPVSPGQK